MATPPAIAQRHLVALWSAIREAAEAAESADGEALKAAELAPLRIALGASARRLAHALDRLDRAGVGVAEFADRARVLVVDDEENAVFALATLLSDDFEVTATTEPGDVPALVREKQIEAVVTDLRMPGLDGLELLRLLREAPGPAPAVLVATASDDAAQRLAALSLGAFDFMLKPLDVPELVARLRRAVRFSRDLKREHALQESDALTGLYNRRGFSARLLEELGDRRHAPLAVALIDEDGLKAINDRHGHATGDLALCRIAAALKANQRASDTAARFGGDEFALLMPDTTPEGARALLQRVQETLDANPLELSSQPPAELKVSWGVATAAPEDHLGDGAALLERADAALYAMKRSKRAQSSA